MNPNLAKIPQELKARPQWVAYKSDKTPVNPKTGGNAQADNPTTWGDFNQAVKHLEAHKDNGVSGIGYEFSFYDPFCGIDLDHCRDPESSVIKPWAQEIIKRLNSYTEISPSGTGVHILVKGKLPPGADHQKNLPEGGKIEVYDVGRYFTVTGDHLEGTPAIIQDRDRELKAFHAEVIAKPKAPPQTTGLPPTLNLADSEIIAKARAAQNGDKFDRLLQGDWVGSPTQSEADLALCSILAFWTRDPGQIDRIVRQSGLMRDKWDRRQSGSTYGAKTIEKALSSTTETYQGAGFNRDNVQHSWPAGETPAPGDPKSEFTKAELLNFAKDGQVGDARLFIRLFREKYCYDHAAGLWYEWSGHLWVEDEKNKVLMALDRVVDLYEKQALYCAWNKAKATREDDKEAAKRADYEEGIFLKKITQLQRENYRRDVLQFAAAGDDSLGITGKEWDKATFLLPCANGTLNLKTGTFRPGQPQGYIKTACPTEWRGLIEPAPEWENFLNGVFDGDQELIAYVQRLTGYAISGQRSERELPIFTGQGWNGKGTFFETAKYVLGDLAGPVPAEILLEENRHHQKSGGAPTPEIMALRGKRLVWASETNEGRRLNAGKAKWLTGGDTLVGRGLWAKRMVDFVPTHTIFLITNHRPKANPDDYALWGRLHIIPFDLSFVDNPDPDKPHERQRDKELVEKLKKEASGILAWFVRGFDDWQKNGLAPPDRVLVATEQYRQDEDTIGKFIEERCIIAPGAQIQAGEFYQEYKKWCEENGYKPIWGNTFAERVGRKFKKDETKKARFYIGVGMLE